MAIPKKQLNFIVELMSALPIDGTQYQWQPEVSYCPHDFAYFGYFDKTIINKMQQIGVITIIGEHDDEMQSVLLVERDDFLSSFAAGVREAMLGNDLHYADYNSNQYAFSCGYEHCKNRLKKKNTLPYNRNIEHVCHGFMCIDTNEYWNQK